jgi:two-component system NtrC family sensor kinase
MRKIFFLYSLMFFAVSMQGSNAPIRFSSPESWQEIGGSVEILEDNTNKLTIEQVVHSDQFQASNQKVPNKGLSSSTFWIKFSITNTSDLENLLLMLEQPVMDEIALYTVLPDGKYTVRNMGEQFPFSNREFNVPDYIFKLGIPTNSTLTYLIRLKSSDQIQIPLVLASERTVFENLNNKNILSGIYFGIMLVMILYNLFIYFSVHDKSYLYYVLYIIAVTMTQAELQGYPFQFLWPDSSLLAMHAEFFFPAIVGIAGLAFLRVFIHTKEYTPRLARVTYIWYALYALSFILALLDIYTASYITVEITAVFVSIYIFSEALIITRKGYRPAKFFLIAWSIFLVGICIFVMKDFGILPFNNFTRYTMQAGSALEVVLISFGLADRINILKKEKEESQSRALDMLKENERIIKEQNVVLEWKVMERTEELRKANTELSITFNHLKETQSQLLDAEKMASLGQLTAGIAHEINNPINFVKSNIKSLRRTVEEIELILVKYSGMKAGPNLELDLATVQKMAQEVDLNYSLVEVQELMDGIEDGAGRTAEIIKGLRNFSRTGEDNLKRCDIHEGIDSTLVLLNGQIKGQIQLVKTYGTQVQIDCYPGKLNQVFMNIISNAIQAVSEKHASDGKGRIEITTYEEEGNLKIDIADNGSGMKIDMLNRIFEPFFTTKPIGKGIGLGLSIAYTIIEKHHGKISVKSVEGNGSVFSISLPIQQ